ncbi:unnamed protein product [Meloidogyne enterolobii]|uniref:Uncharacterized protein n=1 Tax=Meloidogyne enterolobii TaxID=390850 RepID=A0ACB0Z4I3_MELEN
MFSSSTKICLFFLSIFVLFQLNNGGCVDIGGKCGGKSGKCCTGGSCTKGNCCIAKGQYCLPGHYDQCCPGTTCKTEVGRGNEKCM